MKTNLSALTYVTLKDGRRLGYAEFGFKNGFPILFHEFEEIMHIRAGNFNLPFTS